MPYDEGMEGPRRKTEILKQMQSLQGERPNDIWNWDGLYEPWNHERSYDYAFAGLLKETGFANFDDLVERRAAELGRPLVALDLFGGAYFLKKLDHIAHMVGVRLRNMDEAYVEDGPEVEELATNPRREIIEGNLYTGETWRRIDERNTVFGAAGFDLITCRPQGPFGHTSVKSPGVHLVAREQDAYHQEEIFISLLNRTLALLSPEGGLLYLQTPNLGTPEELTRDFWERLVVEKKDQGYTFFFEKRDREGVHGDRVAVRRGMPSGEAIPQPE